MQLLWYMYIEYIRIGVFILVFVSIEVNQYNRCVITLESRAPCVNFLASLIRKFTRTWGEENDRFAFDFIQLHQVVNSAKIILNECFMRQSNVQREMILSGIFTVTYSK